MERRQKQVIEMYQRVQDFLGANPPPTSAGYTIQKQALDGVVAKLTGHSTDQATGKRLTRAEFTRQRALRRRIREEHLGPIAKIARATLSDVPGIEKALRMPAENLSTGKLLQEASAVRAAASKYAPVFIESGRPEDFLTTLDSACEELRVSVLERARGVGQHVGAKAGMEKEIKRGRKAVDLLDTIVTSAFAGRLDILAKWRVAKRLRAVPSSSVASVDSAAPTVGAAPSAGEMKPAA